jgi:hypothetical protein
MGGWLLSCKKKIKEIYKTYNSSESKTFQYSFMFSEMK